MDFEYCKTKIEDLLKYYSENQSLRNEATTRLHLIDRIFFECLGWERNDCIAEEPHGKEFTDYTFSTTRRVLIIEAKKEGNYFELPIGEEKNEYSIKTLMESYQNLKEAINQVTTYCNSRGVPIATICNGHQIVTFIATRNDGIAPNKGKVIIFPSIQAMKNEFLLLWNYLSKPGIENNNLQGYLLGNIKSPLPPKLSTKIQNYPGLKDRNSFQTDLKILSDFLLEDLPGGREIETEFLKECYCHSGALSQYALISKEVLKARYEALFNESHPGPTIQPATDKSGISSELLAEGLSRRPILLIGDVGVGKTTFIRNLIKVEASGIFEKAITLYIDLGTQAILSEKLKDFILNEITNQIYEKYDLDIQDGKFVKGVYNIDLQRFNKGIYGELKEVDPNKYKQEEIRFLESKINLKDQHLKFSLQHISKGHRKQIVIFLDNSDQREYDTQQKTFLIAQELATNWPATVFIAIRPETFHKSMRNGALSGYHPKAFTISPPRVDKVLNKRLDFGIRLASGEMTLNSLEEIYYKLPNIISIIKVFQSSIDKNDELIEAIDNISGGNIRQALYFVREFFGSGHVATQKIVEIYNSQGDYYIPLHEFLRAIIFRDASYYDPDQSPILNFYDINTYDSKSHFTLPIMIGIINSLTKNSQVSGFIEISKIFESLQNLGFTPSQIEFALNRAIEKRLLETEAHETSSNVSHHLIRLTTIGAYHFHRLISMFTYFDAILVDTPILLENFRKDIDIETDISGRIKVARTFKSYLDTQWKESKIKTDAFDWKTISKGLENNFKYVLKQYKKRFNL